MIIVKYKFFQLKDTQQALVTSGKQRRTHKNTSITSRQKMSTVANVFYFAEIKSPSHLSFMVFSAQRKVTAVKRTYKENIMIAVSQS